MPWLTCLPHCPSCLRPLFYNGWPTRTQWILQACTIPAQHSETGRPSRTQEFIIWIVLPSSPSTELKGPSFINTCRYNLNISSRPSSWSSVCSLVWSLFSAGTEVSLMDANVVPECWPNRLLSDWVEEKVRKSVSLKLVVSWVPSHEDRTSRCFFSLLLTTQACMSTLLT